MNSSHPEEHAQKFAASTALSSSDEDHPLEIELARDQLAIHVEDLISRRLLEGVGLQLNLKPILVSDEDLANPANTEKFAIIVADKDAAERFRAIPAVSDHPSSGLRPALVAVVPFASPEETLLPSLENESQFDGILVLPESPSLVLARLSVILYAHRTTILRYEPALDELHLNRRIFRSVTSGISVADARKPDLPLIYVNPAFEVITGYSLEESAGKNCRFLQREERDQPGRVLIREAIRDKRATVVILRNFKKDGTPFWNELSMSPIFDREGTLTHYVGIQNDVTARVGLEEALRQSEKLAATGRLAASIAHEINNPLEALTNLLYLAQQETDPGERTSYIAQAQDELKRVSSLTTQSLRFYRQTSSPRAVRIGEIVNAVLGVYSAKLAAKDIRVHSDIVTEDSIVCLDSELRQVLSNLVSNAIDAMKGVPGLLTVKTRNGTQWRRDTKGVVVTIADEGRGMSEETKKRLFEAFYTTKADHGTGLGLWLSKEIIDRHHGQLSVRSRQENSGKKSGTVFRLFLPFQAINPEEE